MNIDAPPPSSPRLIIDLDAVRSNYLLMAKCSGTAKTGAAIKADAYGLGLEKIAPVLANAGCRSFFCAHLSEAIAARKVLGGKVEIFVLNGVSPSEIARLHQEQLTPILSTPEQIIQWREGGDNAPAALHVDTGLNRLGLEWRGFDPASAQGLNLTLVMSHLACAADTHHPLNATQLERFGAIAAHFPGVRASLASSAGILHGAEWHFDLTRPGIALYGGAPLNENSPPLVPTVRIEAPILQIRFLRKGDSVGYGSRFTAAHDMTIATAAIGYADGLPIAAQKGGFGRSGQHQVSILGRVSMDLSVFDVSHISPKPKPGDVIVLLGNDLEVLALAADTLSYELLTGLGSRFVRKYKGRGA